MAYEDGPLTTAAENQQSTLGELLAPYEPGLQADSLAYQNYGSQLANLPAETQQTNDYQTAMAGIQGQQLGISAQELGNNTATAAAQQGQEVQQYGLQQQGLQEQSAEQALSYKNTVQATQGNAAASGALNTEGTKSQIATNAQQNQWANADIGRSEQNAALGQQSELEGFNNSQSNAALMAQANGLSVEQLNDQLQYGIAQNKQTGISSAGQLLGQMGSLASGDITTAGTALAPIAYSAGINPFAQSVG